MMMKSLTLILIFFTFYSFGQHSIINNYDIPSLKRVQHDTTKINILLEKLGYKYENINPDSSIYFYTIALEIAQNSPAIHENNGKLKEQFLTYQATAYRYIGIIYRTQGLFDRAIKNYIKALKIAENLNDKKLTSSLYANVGNVLFEQKSYNRASWYYNKSLKIDLELKNKIGISEGYACIAAIYYAQKKYQTALSYNLKALKIADEIQYKNVIPFCYSNIGLIQEAQKNYDGALSSYNKALKISKELEDKSAISSIYQSISKLHLTIANSDKNLSKSDQKFHLKKALEFGEMGFKLALQLKSFTLQNSISNSLQKTYTKLGDYSQALKYAEIYIATNDSIFQENKTRIIAEMELKYKSKNNQLEIEKLAKDSELQQTKINRQKIILSFFIGGTFLIFIFLLLLLRFFKQKKKANLEIVSQRDEILNQHEKLVFQNKLMLEQSLMITDSINYAKRLQQVIFPNKEYLDRLFGEYFVLLKAKDIVSGDFYWTTQVDDFLIIAVADCTGHGVPGALMSMLGMSNLNEIVRHKSEKNAAIILDTLRSLIIDALNQKGTSEEQKDGLDIALCVINVKTLEMQYSGAYLSCLLVKESTKELIKINGDKMPIGIHPQMSNFTNKIVQLEKGDSIYLMSDGYQDQFGGPKNHKFLPKKIQNLLLKIQDKSMSEQKEILNDTIEDWKSNYSVKCEQTDDITVFGFKIGFDS